MCLIIDQDVAVDRRDGTVLRADVYCSDSRETLPVLLCVGLTDEAEAEIMPPETNKRLIRPPLVPLGACQGNSGNRRKERSCDSND